MEPTDITVEILKNIRDEIRETRTELRETRTELSTRIDETRAELSARIDETNARVDALGRRQVDTEVRLATELTAVAAAVREVRDELRIDRALRRRVDDHEARIAALERRGG